VLILHRLRARVVDQITDTEIFVGCIHPRAEDAPDSWKGALYLDDVVPVAMADPMWFNANIAFAECIKDVTLSNSCRKSDIVVKYQSKALNDLRRRLEINDVSWITLYTITVLICIDILIREPDHWKLHNDGLERIIALEGGLESLNNKPFLKSKLIGFNAFWLNKQMAMAIAQPPTIYPKHPFSAGLCTAIAKLPTAFAELTFDRSLNTALVMLMADTMSLANQFRKTGTKPSTELRRLKLYAYEIEELFTYRTMTHVEQIIAAAFLQYAISMDDDRSQHWLLCGTINIGISNMWCKGIEYVEKHAEVITWAGAMLIACSEVTALTYVFGVKLLNSCAGKNGLQREVLLDLVEHYLWDPVLTEKMDAKFNFKAPPPGKLIRLPEPPIHCQHLFGLAGSASPASTYSLSSTSTAAPTETSVSPSSSVTDVSRIQKHG
jgi:hypothetical protein